MVWVFVFLTVLFWGLAPIADKLALVKLDPLVAVFVRTVTTAIVLFTLFLGSGRLRALGGTSLRSIALVAASGILGSLLGQYTFYRALQAGGKASTVVPICAAYPLITLVVALLLLRERLSPDKVLGAALIVAGIFLIKR